ncbi:uncharacterized protein MELLADRAFT_103733 [Melampsora larici-populina 98AG31]|uniref:Glutaminase A central domain-containing protein n=1 Tax=Melampsora larici-populina (strain 98AG31 / pathotype 3-4-7) TaxID=747676 RepID=F4RC73_MELLP|nr:uncharacterized protein MELLADRAFT_103733 [Melampsora larici-populina 98AG31]EGG09999.1 hypothetical protein MELLADRAFT_103733 [Melampsora larici-populina 98AG31]
MAFWPIQFPQNPNAYRLGWTGLIRINGITYKFFANANESLNPSNQFKTASQLSFNYNSTRSIFEFEAGEVRLLVDFSSTPSSVKSETLHWNLVLMIGHVRDPYVSYIVDTKETNDLFEFGYHDFENSFNNSTNSDTQISNDAMKIFVKVLGAIEITIGRIDQTGEVNQNDVKIFSKGISSNGDMSPNFPILTYYNCVLLKYLLKPLFEYSESGLFTILEGTGVSRPITNLSHYATAHNDGNDKAMLIEEAGNFLIMTLVIK